MSEHDYTAIKCALEAARTVLNENMNTLTHEEYNQIYIQINDMRRELIIKQFNLIEK